MMHRPNIPDSESLLSVVLAAILYDVPDETARHIYDRTMQALCDNHSDARQIVCWIRELLEEYQ